MVDPILGIFRERWQAVSEIEKHEQRDASIGLRWQQVNAILCLARGLGLHLHEDQANVEIVRQRWGKLKGIL